MPTWPSQTASFFDYSFLAHPPPASSHVLSMWANFSHLVTQRNCSTIIWQAACSALDLPVPSFVWTPVSINLSIGHSSIALQILHWTAILNLRPVDPSLGRLPRVWRQSQDAPKPNVVTLPSGAEWPSTLGRKRDGATIPNEKITLSQQDQAYIVGHIARTWAHYKTRLEGPQ